MSINKCLDCKKEINKVSKRCRSCANRFRKGKYFISEKGKRNIRKGHQKEEVRRKIGESNTGDKNGMWKGDKVGLNALHDWVKKRKPKPNLCEKCKKKRPHDLANISQKYKRDIKDFEWLCRRCHMKKDGRLNKLNKGIRK